MNETLDAIQSFFGDVNLQGGVVRTLGIVLVMTILRSIALAVLRRQVEDVRIRYRWRKTITYVTFTLGALWVALVWSEGVTNLLTFLGLVSAGLAIAFRDPIVNLGGWAFILWRRPFVVGDRVQVGQHAGDVIDQRIFAFTLLEIGNWVHADQSTGRIIHIPNGVVFRDPLANYTRGMHYIWNEIPVLITFESNWRKAKEILTRIAEERTASVAEEARQAMAQAARKYMIFYKSLTPIVYTNVQDSGVLLTIRYLCKPRHRRGTAEGLWEAILTAFGAENDIDFAYPTRRMFYNALEGKEGARAEPGALPHPPGLP